MNWDALGAIAELLGATAVLVTIIYIAIQVKKTSQAAQAQSLASAQQINLEETSLWLEHYDLIAKANTGEPISDAQQAKLRELVMSRSYSAFLGHSRAAAIGEGNWYNATNFARLLNANPGAKAIWSEVHARNPYRNPSSKAFADKVEENLTQPEGMVDESGQAE